MVLIQNVIENVFIIFRKAWKILKSAFYWQNSEFYLSTLHVSILCWLFKWLQILYVRISCSVFFELPGLPGRSRFISVRSDSHFSCCFNLWFLKRSDEKKVIILICLKITTFVLLIFNARDSRLCETGTKKQASLSHIRKFAPQTLFSRCSCKTFRKQKCKSDATSNGACKHDLNSPRWRVCISESSLKEQTWKVARVDSSFFSLSFWAWKLLVFFVLNYLFLVSELK